MLIRLFSQSTVKSIWQEQATEPANNMKSTAHQGGYSAPDSWAGCKYAVSTCVSADRKAEISSCRRRCMLSHACTQVQHLLLCGTRTSDCLPAPLLLQRNRLQQATGDTKVHVKDLKNTPVFLVTLCKEGIGFHSPAQTGWKNRWDTSLRGMRLQVRNKRAFLHAGRRQ